MNMSFPCWSTASSFTPQGDEVTDLHAHLSLCRGEQGRPTLLQELGRTMNRFVSARFVTSLAVLAIVIGAASFAI